MTIPSTIEQVGGGFYKAPAKIANQADVSSHVAPMLEGIPRDGIVAVRRFFNQYDGRLPSTFRVAQSDINRAIASVANELRESLHFAHGNIRKFATEQLDIFWHADVDVLPGVSLGHRVKLIRNVGA